MARRVGTIEDIAWRGHRLRLWCFGCARSRVLDAGKVLQLFADKGWELGIEAARRRFPCALCRSPVNVLILPARAPVPESPPPSELQPARTWAAEVEAFFHGNRAKRKERPLPKVAMEAIARLAEKMGPGDHPGPARKRIEDLD